MDPATIVALVGLGVLFFLVIFIWVAIYGAYKMLKTDIKYAIGTVIAFQQQITNTFTTYAEYIVKRTTELKDAVIVQIDVWMNTLNQLIQTAEVAKLRHFLLEKLDTNNLEATLKINREIINDLLYTSNDSKQAILSTMNALDNYVYGLAPGENIDSVKTMLLTHQIGASFASSLSYVLN